MFCKIKCLEKVIFNLICSIYFLSSIGLSLVYGSKEGNHSMSTVEIFIVGTVVSILCSLFVIISIVELKKMKEQAEQKRTN